MNAAGLEFDPVAHIYRVNGKIVPNVTKVLDTTLVDFSMVKPSDLEFARVRGVAVHRACELYDRDDLNWDTLDPQIVPYLEAWIRFKKENDFIVLNNELKVYSPSYRYAGTLDRTGLLGGKGGSHDLVDIKARTSMTPEIGPQTAAYGNAFTELYRIKLNRRFSLQLLPDGHYRMREYNDPSDLSTFLSCLQIYNFKRLHKMIKENA